LFAGEYKPNPYLDQQADAIRNKVNQNLSLNIMPSIRSGAMAAGQYGGSRQGIAEGVASGLASQGLSDSLSNLYGNAYNIDQNQITNRTGQNQAFYTNQRGQDLNQYALGANMFTQGLQGNLGLGSAMYGLGQQYMNAPLGALQQYSNTISPYSGLNSTQATTSNSGAGGITGALGGAMGGLQMYKNLGFGGQAVSAPSSLNSTNIYSGSSTPDLSMGYYGSFGG
jgi:hypothetical protein